MPDLTELFCLVDDFCVQLERSLPSLPSPFSSKRLKPRLYPSEIITLLLLFHFYRFRDFKTFYLFYAQTHLRKEFPLLVSYHRFIALLPRHLFYLFAFLLSLRGACSGVSFIDSTPLIVCHPKRISRHKVFKGLAQLGKSSTGWFYGFKLHLVVNDRGELLSFWLTPGNYDDRAPVPQLMHHIFGKVFGDKGYISQQLFEELYQKGVELITRLRKNMKGGLRPLIDTILIRKRSLIETINDQLKNISQIEHTRHRSVLNFCVHLMAGLAAYCLQPKKPSLNIQRVQGDSLSLVL